MIPVQISQFDVEAFLRDHWQKQPLLIKNPWDGWENPLDPDELAGLACEPGIESRLITQADDTLALEHGPLAESRFAQLGADPWTLLVQAVDHHVPDVAALLEPFRFIPNWRIDDVMVSYAVDRGGVGPHFDQYDVFLIQGLGRRRWQIGAPCDDQTPLLPHADLRLLADFEPTQEWVLEPGDILYVPPGIPHNGVAVGDDCMTYSVGFRAPSCADLIDDWSDHVLDQPDSDQRYADPDLVMQDNPGEITAGAIDGLHALITAKLLDRDAFARWFGEYNTMPKNAEIDWAPETPVTAAELRDQAPDWLVRNPASRFSFIRSSTELVLFVDGASYPCTDIAAEFAERLCAADAVAIDAGDLDDPATLVLIVALINRGCIEPTQDD